MSIESEPRPGPKRDTDSGDPSDTSDTSDTSDVSDASIAQWERAHQAWRLVVKLVASQLDADSKRLLIRTLRVKKSERSDFLAALPGTVRQGARVDLEHLEAALRAAGIPCVLEYQGPDQPGRRSARFE